MVDPSHMPDSSPPAIAHVEAVLADNRPINVTSPVRVPPSPKRIAIIYTALSLASPERIRFRYILDGFDRNWSAPVATREAVYTNLGPGSYRFRVIASNSSGMWNEAGTSLDFSIAPAYYQTNWFRFLCVAFFLGLLWTLYRLRVHQIQRQFAAGLEASVGERLRIARELHDTMLQTFQAAAYQFQAARKLLLRNSDNAMEAVDEAIQSAEEGIKEGRAAIGDLRPEPAAQRSLSELLNATGRELAEADNLNGHAPSYHVFVEGKPQDLSPMLQDEVYRISREVIRNAFMHAAASHIEVEIRYDQHHLRLRIRDDGKGITPKILEAGGTSGHFGIPGMRERAKRIGSQLEFWSEEGAGTEVQFQVPASMAYQKRGDGRRFRFLRKATSMSSAPGMIRILAVDDHALLRKGLAAVVNAEPDMKLVAEASNGEEAVEKFRIHRPDVTLMDLQMPGLNGIEATIRILSEFPDARIIVLTTYNGDAQVLRALRAGARAYLLKGHDRELIETIHAVFKGQKRIPPEVAAELAEHATDDELSEREIEVLQLIAVGNSNKQIADLLFLAEATMKSRVTNIFSKLGASDRAHAVTIALKRGIIEL